MGERGWRLICGAGEETGLGLGRRQLGGRAVGRFQRCIVGNIGRAWWISWCLHFLRISEPHVGRASFPLPLSAPIHLPVDRPEPLLCLLTGTCHGCFAIWTRGGLLGGGYFLAITLHCKLPQGREHVSLVHLCVQGRADHLARGMCSLNTRHEQARTYNITPICISHHRVRCTQETETLRE